MSIHRLVGSALDAVCNGYSADRVVLDPEMNEAFIAECRKMGLAESAATLNLCLLNLRKSGGRKGKKTANRTSFADESEYRFASEVAIRFLERRDQISVDVILSDPVRATEFDQLASRLAPGYSPLQYRWAALNLRKMRRLAPELLSRVKPSIKVHTIAIADLKFDQLPASQGLYIFFDSKSVLYAGETTNLRKRIEKHLDHSDNKEFARWLWGQGPDTLHLEWHLLEKDTPTRVRKALEAELIASRRPIFNVQCNSPRSQDDG